MRDDDTICDLELLEAGRRIHAGESSSVATTTAVLARIAAREPRLHSYATLVAERALAQAEAADREIAAGRVRGPLHGVPIAVKDLCDTAGIVTAAGMPIRRDVVPARDATVVARLLAAGAVLLGKLQMTEGAFSGHHPAIEAPVNPWSPSHWTGVSSSGSGVALAAGLCFGALGSDTLGSIRFPSTMNGVTGLKPTWGRVSRAGVFALAPSMDHVGPMARSAADVAALLAAIAGADPDDPTAARVPVPDYLGALGEGVGTPARPLRIGFDRRTLEAGAEVDVVALVERALGVFAGLGVQVREIALPPLDPVAHDALRLCVAEAAVVHEQTFPSRREAYGPVLAGLLDTGRAVGAPELLRILERRAAFTGRVSALFEHADLVIVPAMNRAAPTNEDLARQVSDLAARMARLRFTAPFDMSRHPSLTLPGGASAQGVPIGFQLVGAHFDEARLLAAGHAFQRATDWHRRRPPS